MSKNSFVPLHVHSDASFLDAMNKPEELAARAKELGYTALAVTDHGAVHNFIRIYQACQKQGIKFIPGCELYFTHRHKDREDRSFHLTVLAKDNAGLRNLYKMLTWANIPVDDGGGYYRKPRVSWRELRKYHEGLICLTGCMNSPVNQAFLESGYDAGKKHGQRLLDIFDADRLFVEVQNANDEGRVYIPEHKKLLKWGRRLSDDLGVARVATNDCHYLMPEDAEHHEILKCISTGANLYTPIAEPGRPGRIKFKGYDYYLKSDAEMRKKFTTEEVDTSGMIADMCDVRFRLKKDHMPRFSADVSPEQTFEMLVAEARKGWRFWKLGQKKNVREYKKRMRMELKDIQEAGLTDYFMLVWDTMKFVDDQKIGRGFSRGSAGGSLVSYCLRVCLVDPIEHGLIWERFWNRGRKGSMPDIDLDLDPLRRGEVIEYLKNKFGRNRVFPMMTMSKFRPKAVVKDVGKAVGLPYNYMNSLTKHFPHKCKSVEDAIARSEEIGGASQGEDSEVKDWQETVEALTKKWKKTKKRSNKRDFRVEGEIVELQQKIAERARKLVKTFKVAKRLENVARQRGKHACALLIADKPVFGRVPLAWDTKDKTLMTAFDMYDVEKLGYLKLDVLGLANATVLSMVLENGVYDVIKQGFEDPKAFKVISSGSCKGVFQLEKALGQQWSRKIQPKNLEELAALISIIRPAVLETGLAGDYLKNRKAGKWKLIHKDLNPIFAPTYGIMCYQEQMLEVVKRFGGFDLSHADMVRKACGKKLPEEMAKHQKDFAEGCKKNGYSKEIADKLWEWIAASAGYSFNKSHAIAYAMMAYATAWLKARKPLKFYRAMLSLADYAQKPREEISELYYDAKLFKVSIKGPDFRLGNEDFKIIDDHIAFGLKHIRDIGSASVALIASLKNANWGSFVLARKKINKKVLRALIYSGAMDGTGLGRLQMDLGLEFANGLTDRENQLLKSLLRTGEPVELGKDKIVDLGKARTFRHAVEKLRDFLAGDNVELKAINKNRAEKILDLCEVYLDSKEEELDTRTKAGYEIFYLGIPATCSEVDVCKDKQRTHTCIQTRKAGDNQKISTIGVLMGINRRKTRNNTEMAFVKFADKTYMMEGLMFEDAVKKNQQNFQEGRVALLKGVKRRGGFVIESIKLL